MRTRAKLIATSAATKLTFAASAAQAVSVNTRAPAAAAPVPMTVAPAPTLGDEWTGGYAGVQLGYGDVDASGGADGDDFLYGVHVGYNYDFGTFVPGGELDYDLTDIDLGGGVDVDDVARLKVKAGYDVGQALGYVTAGVAEADTSLGSESGEFYGIGVSYQITDQHTVGAELLEHNFDDISGTGVDADATTPTVWGSIRF